MSHKAFAFVSELGDIPNFLKRQDKARKLHESALKPLSILGYFAKADLGLLGFRLCLAA
jgi:hypothetical protein